MWSSSHIRSHPQPSSSSPKLTPALPIPLYPTSCPRPFHLPLSHPITFSPTLHIIPSPLMSLHAVWYKVIKPNPAQHNATQPNPTQSNPAKPSSTQPNATHHDSTRRNATQQLQSTLKVKPLHTSTWKGFKLWRRLFPGRRCGDLLWAVQGNERVLLPPSFLLPCSYCSQPILQVGGHV